MQPHTGMVQRAPDGLEAKRLALGLSREALGQRAGGLASTTVKRLERGLVRRPHRVTLEALARALHCRPEDLLPPGASP
jgi:transcriptional regulator with XRE-family HTH domain